MLKKNKTSKNKKKIKKGIIDKKNYNLPEYPLIKPSNFRESVYDIMLYSLENNYFDIKENCGKYFNFHNIDDYKYKSAVRNIVAGIFRNYIFIEYIITNYSNAGSADYEPLKKALIYSGIYEILFCNTPAYAVVNENVNICKNRIDKKFAGFVNAVLKKISAEKNKIFINRNNLNPSIKYSIPEPLLKNIIQIDFNRKNINTILDAYNNAPHYYIIPNINKCDSSDLKQKLTADEIEFSETKIDAAVLNKINPLKIVKLTKNIGALTAIKESAGYIQDLSSFLCALFISAEAKTAEIIVDFCAAPGLKTVSMVNSLNTVKSKKIIISDINAGRLKIAKKNFDALLTDKYKKNIFLFQADSLNSFIKLQQNKKTLLYIDAPCSGSGIISRYPEMLMFKNEEDILALAQKQYVMLSKLINSAPAGTKFIYSVCSITAAETFSVIEKIFKNFPDISNIELSADILKKIDGKIKYFHSEKGLLILPQKDVTDGFFISAFIKK